MAKIKTLKVWPNPFHAVDHEGYPSCILPCEPEGDGVTTFDDRRFVGASLSAEMLQKFPRGDARQSIQRTRVVYADEPVTVKNSPYYAHAIMRGEIFAADEVSAKAVGIQKFLDPAVGLQLEKEAAVGLWKRQNHEEHDGVPDALSNFAFGPMVEAIKARAAASVAVVEADKKADAAKKASQPTKGGE